MNTEIQFLQNFADKFEMKVHEKYFEDRRRTTKKYFLMLGTHSVSPVLDYEQMNHFLLGWNNCLKHTQ